MSSWHSYGSIYNVGHPAASELFDGPVTIEEKVDGSQFSFGLIDGELKCRSKGAVLVVDHPEKMFSRAIETVKRLDLIPGFTYRAEYLQKPKHNTIAYDRHPKDHLVLFDIAVAEESYISYGLKLVEAARLGLEVVPLLFEGVVTDVDQLRSFLDRDSYLGGAKIEGFVIKNYARFGPDKKVLMGKYVSEAFKEAHKVAWKVSNPQKGDVLQSIIEAYRTEARWQKAVGHLRDAGTLENSPRDIAALLKETQADILKECTEEIKRALFDWAKPQILRGVTAGLPDWYKNRLLESAFPEGSVARQLVEGETS